MTVAPRFLSVLDLPAGFLALALAGVAPLVTGGCEVVNVQACAVEVEQVRQNKEAREQAVTCST
jgi:predicted RNA methylase